MRVPARRAQLAVAAVLVTALVTTIAFAQKPDASVLPLDEHPAIQYATRPTTDRVAKLAQTLTRGERTLARDARSGYLPAVLEALGLSVDSQLLVFSKTGVQRAYTSPHTPRALYFDQSVVVGYVPGAPAIEMAAHDPQQGVVFYTIDQTSDRAVPVRRTSCLACHVSASTMFVPGIIVRSNTVDDEGNVMPQLGTTEVTHQTPHPDRWGGWYVTFDSSSNSYAQRSHEGNITFSGRGNTSNKVFTDWLDSAPETRGYLSPLSDVVGLLVFDHQMHAVNLMTKLGWEARIAAADGRSTASDKEVGGLVGELADYLLFANEAPPLVQLSPLPAFARYLESKVPKDHLGRSFGQLDADRRLLKYPCSFMIYSDAFNALPAGVRAAVYQRMLQVLSGRESQPRYARMAATDRQAVLDILRDTKPDFPAQ